MKRPGSHHAGTALERSEMKAQVVEALAKLREMFPLEARIGAAPPPVRDAYRAVLTRWRRDGAPPEAAQFALPLLHALQKLDAVVAQKNGIGCYPFSADVTDFAIHVARGPRIFAFCAIDALAIPRLLGRHARIEARCAACGGAQSFEVGADGGLPEQPLDRTTVVWLQNHSTAVGEACCQQVCPALRVMCANCASWAHAAVFTLPQAAAMANAFFSFQQRLDGTPVAGPSPLNNGVD